MLNSESVRETITNKLVDHDMNHHINIEILWHLTVNDKNKFLEYCNIFSSYSSI